MEFKELQKKKESELHKLLAESRDGLRDLRFKVASRQLKDVASIKKMKKVISNVLTLLNGKSIQGGSATSGKETAEQEAAKPVEENK